MGAVAKSYMRKGSLKYEEMRKYEEAVSHVWLCNCSLLDFLIYEEKFVFFFISVTYPGCLTYPGREEPEADPVQDDKVSVGPIGEAALLVGEAESAGGVEGGGLQRLHLAAPRRLQELHYALVHRRHRPGQRVRSFTFSFFWRHGPNICIKTPNPSCRLYWCLIEFIDWSYSQSCWYFRPLLWTSAPLTFSVVHLPLLPSFPVWISTGVCIHTVCNRGGGIGGLRQINTCRKAYLLVNF